MMRLDSFINVSPGFQYSVNIKFDVTNDEKIRSYIPIKQSVDILHSLVQAFNPNNSERSRLLVGSYGTGKSHLCAVLLALLSRPESLSYNWYKPLLDKIGNISAVAEQIISEQMLKPKVLPVVVTSGGSSFEQSLLVSLQAALVDAGIADCLPQTAYEGAMHQVELWETEYPAAFAIFNDQMQGFGWSIDQWKKRINQYDHHSYVAFETVYPLITHGAKFNPLFHGNVGDTYLSVAQSITSHGYKGIYVIFDEFGQFLEEQWKKNNGAQLKSVQDFAEACNASSDRQLQLLLVTHKPIVQYAVKYGSSVVNEWRKIEGRFKLHELSSTSTSIYEIVSQVILKDGTKWDEFCRENYDRLHSLKYAFNSTRLFADLTIEDFSRYVVEGSFPLHPITTFSLPRLASQVAQNERTIFTFLSTNDYNSLGWFIREESDGFRLLTLDILFDYFEQQIQATESDERIRAIWLATKGAINRLDDRNGVLDQQDIKLSDGIRLLKSLAVIRILNHSAILPPTQLSLKLAYTASDLDDTRLGNAIQELINKGILFEGGSTRFLDILEPSEIDIPGQLPQTIVKRKQYLSLWPFINESFRPDCILAKRYNDEYFMTRYFSCCYLPGGELIRDGRLCIDPIPPGVDGRIYYVVPSSVDEWDEAYSVLNTGEKDRAIFVLPDKKQIGRYLELETVVRQIDALKYLLKLIDESKQPRKADRLLVLLWLNDKERVARSILRDMFEWSKVVVFTQSTQVFINTKADLSRVVSELCASYFPNALKWNNEMINKHRLTRPILNARHKVVQALLRTNLQPNLGLSGTGPEVAIYRSLLKHTQILVTENGETRFNSNLPDPAFRLVMNALQDLFDCSGEDGISFKKLIDTLISPPFGIRIGIVPVIIALYLHRNRQDLTLVTDQGEEMPWTSEQIEEALNKPDNYIIYRYGWTDEKAQLCTQLQKQFSDYIEFDDATGPTRRTVNMMKRWFVSLPRFTRDTRNLSREARGFRKVLKQWNMPSSQFLFQEIPEILEQSYETDEQLQNYMKKIDDLKTEMEGHLHSALLNIETELLALLPDTVAKSTHLLGALKEWYANLTMEQQQYLHSDSAQDVLEVIVRFHTENSKQFLKEFVAKIAGVRPEDWNDSTPRQVVEEFAAVLQEITAFVTTAACTSTASEFSYKIVNADGQDIEKSFQSVQVSSTGSLLKNVLTSYLNDFGDAISRNEKRQILIELLETIADR